MKLDEHLNKGIVAELVSQELAIRRQTEQSMKASIPIGLLALAIVFTLLIRSRQASEKI